MASEADIQVRLRRLWQKQREIVASVEEQLLDLSFPPGGTFVDLEKAASRTESYVRLLFGRARVMDADDPASPRNGQEPGSVDPETGPRASSAEQRPDLASLMRVIKEIHVVTNRHAADLPFGNSASADGGAGGENREPFDEQERSFRDGASRQLELQPFTEEQLALLQKLRGNLPPAATDESTQLRDSR
ncbi:hypothetical protein TGARI_288020 [Toxoplasma gondii ARI]|uniref:Uncharacterized protein n=1 Tax=Toxoplasma gondii ARI TaxID=1074872 RepID=A0A139Y363_TOXGO|nr:hypothetical protein TGARI_288020 [Toxoplasma gondii ARI]